MQYTITAVCSRITGVTAASKQMLCRLFYFFKQKTSKQNHTCAIPEPINPLPITVTFLTGPSRSAVELKQDAIAGRIALFNNANCLVARRDSIA